MKKTSIYLDPDLDRALAREASARGISKAELIRRAAAQVVRGWQQPRITAIAVGSGPGDVADDVDRYLEDGFGDD